MALGRKSKFNLLNDGKKKVWCSAHRAECYFDMVLLVRQAACRLAGFSAIKIAEIHSINAN